MCRFEVRVAAITSAGQGTFTDTIEAFTAEGGALTEPDAGGFVSSIGFIVLMVAIILFIIVCVVVIVLVGRYKCTKGSKAARAGRYHSKPE